MPSYFLQRRKQFPGRPRCCSYYGAITKHGEEVLTQEKDFHACSAKATEHSYLSLIDPNRGEKLFPHKVLSPSSINKHTQPAICTWSGGAKMGHTEKRQTILKHCTWRPMAVMCLVKERKRKRKSHLGIRWKTLECAGCQAESHRVIKPTIGPHRACVSVIRGIVCPECLSF